MWDNLNDCQNQLVGTIVREGHTPVEIEEVWEGGDGGLAAGFHTLTNMKKRKLAVADLNLAPVPLGYVNNRGTSEYAVRMPERRWKHGLDSGNIRQVLGGDTHRVHMGEEFMTGLERCIQGEYPTFSETVDLVSKGYSQRIAFSRLFAIDHECLWYKGSEVGNWSAEEVNPFSLYGEHAYLQELLTEEMRNAKGN